MTKQTYISTDTENCVSGRRRISNSHAAWIAWLWLFSLCSNSMTALATGISVSSRPRQASSCLDVKQERLTCQRRPWQQQKQPLSHSSAAQPLLPYLVHQHSSQTSTSGHRVQQANHSSQKSWPFLGMRTSINAKQS